MIDAIGDVSRRLESQAHGKAASAAVATAMMMERIGISFVVGLRHALGASHPWAFRP